MPQRPGSHVAPGLLSVLATLALPLDRTDAAPVIDLSWDACSPIIAAKQPGSGETVFSMFLSVTGFADTHVGYNVEVFLAGGMECGTSTTSTPDAWRFDSAGCQGRALGPVSLESNSAACPALAPTMESSIIDFSRIDDPQLGPVGAMRLVVSTWYPQTPRTPEPGQRYQLFRMDFHHGASVSGSGTPGETCGGFGVPICVALFSGTSRFPGGGGGECDWVERERGFRHYLDETEHDVPFTIGQDLLSFGLEPGTAFSCFEAVPAQGTTWGAIKAQYR